MSLFGALAEFTREGEVVARGEIALDGTNPTSVATGLKSITQAFVTLKVKAAPGTSTSLVTYFVETATPGQLDIYGWKPTATADTALVASDGTELVTWVAIGTIN